MRSSIDVIFGYKLHAQILHAINFLSLGDGLDEVHRITGEEAGGISDGECELAFLDIGDGPLIEALRGDGEAYKKSRKNS